MPNLHEQAQLLAIRPYLSVVFLDKSTEGEPVYVALNPELEGCLSQGDTVAEARRNLNDARVDFIYFLLEDGLNVPEPQFLSPQKPFVLTVPMSEATDIYDNKPDYLWA